MNQLTQIVITKMSDSEYVITTFNGKTVEESTKVTEGPLALMQLLMVALMLLRPL